MSLCRLPSWVAVRRLVALVCGFLLRRRGRPALYIVSVFTILGCMLHWDLVCVNVNIWRHVNRVCEDHNTGDAVGNLCNSLCVSEEMETLACPNFYSGKKAVFSASWNKTKVLLKTPKKYASNEYEPLTWTDDSDRKHFPSETEFVSSIRENVMLKFNISINYHRALELGHLNLNKVRSINLRHIEMQNVWLLLQDNEYMASILYEKYEIFPKVAGTCGPFYAVQNVESITFSHWFSLDDSREEWQRRLRIATLILDYLHDIENSVPEPLYICDMKLSHFGMTEDGKIKYSDLDAVHPLSVINKKTADNSDCEKDSDCDLFDCRSFCNKITMKCDQPVANNNLQLVCEKIYLGWAASGRVLVPGLLLGSHTPQVLMELLQRCANPENKLGTPRASTSKGIKDKLYLALLKINE